MRGTNEPAKAYLRNKILNASPMERVMILYEGAIASCLRARDRFDARRRTETCDALVRAQSMIRELRNALDMSRGEIASGLYRLYSYMIQRLIEANVQRKRENIDQVIRMLTELKQTWTEALSKHGGEAALDGRLQHERLGPGSASESYVSIVT